jgi:Pyruvate/2-oxoacid:ferredoxin oxidoreductase delta subunit
MSEKLWNKVAKNIINAGIVPISVSDTFLEILKTLITEEQMEFLQIFRKNSLNIDQIKAKVEVDDESLNKMLKVLMDNGILVGIPSRTSGIMVYHLSSPLPGLFEFPFMKGETGEKQKKLAQLYDTYFDELGQWARNFEDVIAKQVKNNAPLTRVVTIEEEVEVGQELILPYDDVKKIIEKNDIISTNSCYCRMWKENLNEPCNLNAQGINCLTFGRWGKFLIDHNFGKPISKEEAIKIVKEAENYGLVHKAFHVKQNPELEEQTICNCCSCCCQIFQTYRRGIFPFHTLTTSIAIVDTEKCKGCGICVEKCPIEAIELVGDHSYVNIDRCIGCGICAHHCPEKARTLERTELRRVFIPLPKTG